MTNENSLDTPTVGRVLHFVIETRGGLKCRPAQVTEDWGGKMTVNLCVFPDGTNDEKYGTDEHYHQMMDGDDIRTGKANVPLMVRWESSVLVNNDVRQVRTWHWPRLCKNLEEPQEPYTDNSGRRIHHSHPPSQQDLNNCHACIARSVDISTTTKT